MMTNTLHKDEVISLTISSSHSYPEPFNNAWRKFKIVVALLYSTGQRNQNQFEHSVNSFCFYEISKNMEYFAGKAETNEKGSNLLCTSPSDFSGGWLTCLGSGQI
jgi:hypothetical protein